MGFKYTTYNGFINYIKGILKNKNYVYDQEDVDKLQDFEQLLTILQDLYTKGIITIESDIYNTVIELFITNPQSAFHSIKYMNSKILKFLYGEINFYYIKTSLKTMLHITINFTDEYLRNSSISDKFYPSRINALLVKNDSAKIYGISSISEALLGRSGLYFIFNNDAKLMYIGKSTSCVIKRSFDSMNERNLYDFSKIEYRFIDKKSDVGTYEAFYISRLKPDLNKEFVFQDTGDVSLPEIQVGYAIERNKKILITKDIKYYYGQVIDTNEYLENEAYVDNFKNREFLEEKGIRDKNIAYSNAYRDCINIFNSEQILPASRLMINKDCNNGDGVVKSRE